MCLAKVELNTDMMYSLKKSRKFFGGAERSWQDLRRPFKYYVSMILAILDLFPPFSKLIQLKLKLKLIKLFLYNF